jgi:hypothetical protein
MSPALNRGHEVGRALIADDGRPFDRGDTNIQQLRGLFLGNQTIN